jgi:hypothetical protein
MPISNPSAFNQTFVYPWQLKTGNYTASAGERILADTSVASWVLKFPKNPLPGQEIEIYGVRGLFNNPLQIDLNGAKFRAYPSTIELTHDVSLKFVFVNNFIGWIANSQNLVVRPISVPGLIDAVLPISTPTATPPPILPIPVTPEPEPTPVTPLLLDIFPGASIALALRKLSNSYTGNCIKVNPLSDGVDKNVAFDNNGSLDTSVSNNDKCLAWYDQSGNNRDFFQSNVSRQPLLITPGTSLTLNKPSLYFEASQLLSIAFNNSVLVTPSGEVSIFFVLQSLPKDSVHLTNGIYVNNSEIAAYLPWNDGYTYLEIGNPGSGGIGTSLRWDTLGIASLLKSSSKMYIYKNNQKIIEKSSTVSFNAANAALSLGSEMNGTQGINGYISEVIIYNRYLENHQDLVNELNSYYKVF